MTNPMSKADTDVLIRNVKARGRQARKLDPILGLHFRNVLGDALCDERGLARSVSRVA
jgi:hypothetical protein